MIKQKKESRINTQIHRYFQISKVLLAIAPLICYFYVSMRGLMLNLTFQEVLVQEPNITIIFLIAMINPYIAYLVHLIELKLNTGNFMFAMINMALLLIAQALTMNIFYFLMLTYVFYKSIHYYCVDLKSLCKLITLKQTLLYGGGSLFVMMISSLCLFATIRLL